MLCHVCQGMKPAPPPFWQPHHPALKVAKESAYGPMLRPPHAWRWGPPRVHGLHSNSALFWAPENAGVRQPLLISSLHLVLGTPKNVVVASQFHPLLGPREGMGEATTSDFLPALGARHLHACRGYVAILPSFGLLRRQG